MKYTVYFRFRLKWKKIGKTTGTFRYDLSQIPYEYTLEVTNRFKGLDLIDRVPEKLWMQVCDIIQEAVIKIIPKKEKCKKAKWLSEEALQIAEKRREVKGKGEKERHTHLNAEFQRIARRDKKAFLSEQYKEMVWPLQKQRILRRGARIHRRTVQNDLHDPGNHEGVITHLEPNILECEVK